MGETPSPNQMEMNKSVNLTPSPDPNRGRGYFPSREIDQSLNSFDLEDSSYVNQGPGAQFMGQLVGGLLSRPSRSTKLDKDHRKMHRSGYVICK